MNPTPTTIARTLRSPLVLSALSLSAALAGHRPAVAGDLSALTDPDRYEDLVIDDEVTIEGVELDDGRTVGLNLRRFDILTTDATVVSAGRDGDRVVARPDLVLLRGAIAGDDSSHVFLSVSPHGTRGFIETPHATQVIETGGRGPGADGPFAAQFADLATLPLTTDGAPPAMCQTPTVGESPVSMMALAMSASGPPARRVSIAIETDYEYTAHKFGGDEAAAAAYAITLLAAVSSIYEEQLNVSFEVPYVRTWAQDNDPYDGTIDERLDQQALHWNGSMQFVDRDLTHLLSGNGGGGRAYLGTLCNDAWRYGISGVDGEFPSVLQNFDSGNWDLVVVAHELGHNFGALHSHDYQIDACGTEIEDTGTCNTRTGTIMSYCHVCPGGMSNIMLEFHPQVRAIILETLDGLSCNYIVDDGGNDDDEGPDDPGSCGDGEGDCYSAHDGTGCNDSSCCSTVCEMDPYCCETEWDSICADLAYQYCSGSAEAVRADVENVVVKIATDAWGWLPDLWASDDERLIVRSEYLSGPKRHITQSVLTAYAPISNPASFELSIESKVKRQQKATSVVYLRNWVTNRWDKVAKYTITSDDSQFVLAVPAAQYIKPGNGMIKTLIKHKSRKDGPEFGFDSRFDEVFLTFWP